MGLEDEKPDRKLRRNVARLAKYGTKDNDTIYDLGFSSFLSPDLILGSLSEGIDEVSSQKEEFSKILVKGTRDEVLEATPSTALPDHLNTQFGDSYPIYLT